MVAPDVLKARIKAVAFDAGGTLIEPWPSVGHVYAQVAQARRGCRLDPEAVTRRFLEAWKLRTEFDYTPRAWRRLVEATFDGLLQEPVDGDFFEALYDRFSGPASWRIYDEVLEVLRTLRDAGLKLAVISNWDERLRPLLERLDLSAWFEVITISGEAGCVKPDPELFHRTAAALGVEPGEMLHVGDSEEEDYRGATGAGCTGVWLRRRPGAGAAFWPVIGRLDGLFTALDI